jgi:hypothetical protein
LICDKILAGPQSLLANVGKANKSSSYQHATTNLADVINLAISIVYIRYMEGYHIWRGNQMSALPTDAKQQLRELALYNIVSQCAGTITHCPEKVFEVYDFFLVQLNQSNSYTPTELFMSLTEIFAV